MNGTVTSPASASPASEWKPEVAAETWVPLERAHPARSRGAKAQGGAARQAAYVAIDFTLVCLCGAAAYWLRFGMGNPFGTPRALWNEVWTPLSSRMYPGMLLLYGALLVLSCLSLDLYRTARSLRARDEAIKVIKAVFLATALLSLFLLTSGNKEISRLVIALAAALNVSTLAGWRYAKRQYVLRRARQGEGLARVLIVGAGKTGKALAEWLRENRELGYSVCGFLDAHPNGDPRVLGTIHDLRHVALEQFVDQVFVTLPTDREMVKELFLESRRLRLILNVVPDLYDGLAWSAPVQLIGGLPVIELHGQPIPVLGLAVKRLMDVAGALAGLALTAPVLVLAAIWIGLDSRGPVFYSALRVGRKGKRFCCYKLRTMVAEAEAQKERLRCANERNGPFFKMENDPRVTRCGRWLRKFSVDELPQLFNVLLGEMSLVGPRPHPLDDFERYHIEHLRRLDVKPGVTGLWQVNARSDPSFEANMKFDLHYIEDWSLWLDLKILAKTIPAVLRAEGH
ncbi:MAG TPA: sugar transferase [Candidatus Acidoferrum sp.]|nr:sugar transferase [Candidatus Acidoferrum sp.]